MMKGFLDSKSVGWTSELYLWTGMLLTCEAPEALYESTRGLYVGCVGKCHVHASMYGCTMSYDSQ